MTIIYVSVGRWVISRNLELGEYWEVCPSTVAERLRRRICNQKIAGSNPASGHLATPFRKEI